MCFRFKQMQNEDIAVFINEMFEILASNMNVIAPTGNSYDADFKIWSECVVPVWREGKRLVILIFCEDTLCGFFQYFVNYKTFRMDEIQFKKEYQGCGLFAELYAPSAVIRKQPLKFPRTVPETARPTGPLSPATHLLRRPATTAALPCGLPFCS